jgi:hypothetical protein
MRVQARAQPARAAERQAQKPRAAGRATRPVFCAATPRPSDRPAQQQEAQAPAASRRAMMAAGARPGPQQLTGRGSGLGAHMP